MDSGSRQRARDQDHVLTDRLRSRNRPDNSPLRRLRRIGCAALVRSAHGVQGLRRHPVGACGDVGDVQPPGSREAPRPQRTGAREHLPREHHDLERGSDPRPEPRCQSAEHEDHRRLPLRRLGLDVRVHELPLRHQSAVEEPRRDQHERQLPDRNGRAG